MGDLRTPDNQPGKIARALSRWSLVGLLAVGFSQSSLASTGDCEIVPERRIIDALLNLDTERASSLLGDVVPEVNLLPSANFYGHFIDWVAAAKTGQQNGKRTAVNRLLSETEKLREIYLKKNDPDAFLAWNLSAAHASRLLLENEQFVAGYNLGQPAVVNLKKYLKGDNVSESGRHAAHLVIGLFYFYTNSVPEKYEWAESLIRPTGDIDRGRMLIESVLSDSPRFAPLAARALLVEVPWSTPGICDYRDLARTMTARYPDNPEFSIALQGAALRCGYPEEAVQEQLRFRERVAGQTVTGFGNEDYDALLDQGWMRAMAATGNLAELNNFATDDPSMEWFRLYVQANGLDANGQRQLALEHYQVLAENDVVPEGLRKNAEMRIEIPFTVPETIPPQRTLNLSECHA